jgi:hypothetical protein
MTISPPAASIDSPTPPAAPMAASAQSNPLRDETRTISTVGRVAPASAGGAGVAARTTRMSVPQRGLQRGTWNMLRNLHDSVITPCDLVAATVDRLGGGRVENG